MTATAIARVPAGPVSTNDPTYLAHTIAMTAMMPECIVQNIAQPQRKPASGENVSRRKM